MKQQLKIEDITCVALNEDKGVISYHDSVEYAKKVEGVAYVRPATLEWCDATQPEDDSIQLGNAWREDVDIDDIPEADHPRDEDGEVLEDYYPSIRIDFGNCHAFVAGV